MYNKLWEQPEMALLRSASVRKLDKLCRIVMVGSILSLSFVESAWAYLDPATGWMILQGLIAAVMAAGVAVGAYWSSLKSWFSRRTNTRVEEGAESPKRDQE